LPPSSSPPCISGSSSASPKWPQHYRFAAGVFWVGVWFVPGIIWFALVGHNRLVKAPEEVFAIEASRR
jgi:hypothetical protein